MSCSLKSCLFVSRSNETIPTTEILGFCTASSPSQFNLSRTRNFPVLSVDFMGQSILVSDQKDLRDWNKKAPNKFSVLAQASVCISRSMRWWDKALKPNMVEIHSAQELVDSLLDSGDRLIVIDFYSPGCGGCKALHPKICQLAEFNPNAIFLKVNYEELKTMCQCLQIHVLPFFKLYRGAEGHLCSFSCTNATIKKFKDAMAKHGADRCSLGPAKGLNESELLKLASLGECSINLPPFPFTKEERVDDLVIRSMELCDALSKAENKIELEGKGALV